MSVTIPAKDSSRTCAIDSFSPQTWDKCSVFCRFVSNCFIFDDILAAQFSAKLEPCSAKLKNKGPLIVLKFENILHSMNVSFPC